MGNRIKFGQFLIENAKGQIKPIDIYNALILQQSLSDEYKKIGEILVSENKLTIDELNHYLNKFEEFSSVKLKK